MWYDPPHLFKHHRSFFQHPYQYGAVGISVPGTRYSTCMDVRQMHGVGGKIRLSNTFYVHIGGLLCSSYLPVCIHLYKNELDSSDDVSADFPNDLNNNLHNHSLLTTLSITIPTTSQHLVKYIGTGTDP